MVQDGVRVSALGGRIVSREQRGAATRAPPCPAASHRTYRPLVRLSPTLSLSLPHLGFKVLVWRVAVSKALLVGLLDVLARILVDAVEEEAHVPFRKLDFGVGDRVAHGTQRPQGGRGAAMVLSQVARAAGTCVQPEVELAAAHFRWVGVRDGAHAVTVVVLRLDVELEYAMYELQPVLPCKELGNQACPQLLHGGIADHGHSAAAECTEHLGERGRVPAVAWSEAVCRNCRLTRARAALNATLTGRGDPRPAREDGWASDSLVFCESPALSRLVTQYPVPWLEANGRAVAHDDARRHGK